MLETLANNVQISILDSKVSFPSILLMILLMFFSSSIAGRNLELSIWFSKGAFCNFLHLLGNMEMSYFCDGSVRFSSLFALMLSFSLRMFFQSVVCWRFPSLSLFYFRPAQENHSSLNWALKLFRYLIQVSQLLLHISTYLLLAFSSVKIADPVLAYLAVAFLFYCSVLHLVCFSNKPHY